MSLTAPPLDEGQAAALAALALGQASAAQQRIALRWILVDLCGVTRSPYTAGDPNHTLFLAGAHFAGVSIAQAAGMILFEDPARRLEDRKGST